MPFYQLFAVSRHYPQYAPIRNLVSSTIVFIRGGGGVVRDITYWGQKNLPQVTRQRRIGDGDHWSILFDCNPPTLLTLNKRMAKDPRVVRWNVEKVGSDFKATTRISDISGTFGRSDTILKPKTNIQAAAASKLDTLRPPTDSSEL